MEGEIPRPLVKHAELRDDTRSSAGRQTKGSVIQRKQMTPRFDVTIAGEINMDLILYGVPEELPRERELLADRMMLTLGGSSAILAHNLAALGSRVGFQSRIGDDDFGNIALQPLQQSGVDVSKVHRAQDAKTGLTVILQREEWRNMVTYSGTIADLQFEELDFQYLTSSRHFHVSSFYLQRKLRPRIPELFRKMKEAGLTVSLDTNDDPDDGWEGGLREALRYVDIFMPNEREAQKAAGVDDLEAAVQKLAAIVPLVVVKLGRDGSMAQRGKERFKGAAVSVEAVDPVGAGDSFDAGFLHKYLQGGELPDCLAAGNLAGAFSATRPGGTEAFRDAEYLQRFFADHKVKK
jgi:sugar/nucleoside kinase (ribokinase family)